LKRAILLLSIALLVFSCNEQTVNKIKITKELRNKDLPYILEKGKLTVLFENNSSSYFEYHGANMGFEYEILKEFCKDHQLELDIQIVNDRNEILNLLDNGEVDLVACNLSVTNDRKKFFAFSAPILHTEQVLVQRKLDDDNPEDFISDATQLAQRKVNVWENSAYYFKLKNLQNEMGDTIYIYGENGDISTDYLIEQVADGTIDYTVVDKNIAIINQYYWNNLDISVPLSFKQKIAFGLRKSSVKFKAELDNWIEQFKESDLYSYLHYKYFELPSTAKLALNSSDVSNYATIKKIVTAKTKGKPFGWQLVSAIIYHESRFNPNIIGLGGAFGLFQFIPSTGAIYNVYPSSSIEEQVDGGVRLIMKNYNLWQNTASDDDRIKFTLASYNSGASHLHDAIALARKHGLNPNKWNNNVEVMYRKLSSPEYYNDPVVKYGASRGLQTVNYVYTVFERYNQYRNNAQK
jgi:membrane-bound lytic murein transglycosylase F